MKVFITGISGFVGQSLADECAKLGWSVSGQSLNKHQSDFAVYQLSLDRSTDWLNAIKGNDVVVHCAARVSLSDAEANTGQDIFHLTNTEGTLQLARQAAECGVKRFIFISSIKVNGEATNDGVPFTAEVLRPPVDPYGASKYRAEMGLMKIAEQSTMEIVIIRSPLVYGPGVKANFLLMMNLISKRIPLPFGLVDNKRSMVFIRNLTDFIITAATDPRAVNETFVVSDGHDCSTPELIMTIAKHMRVKALLLPIPKFILVKMLHLLKRDNLKTKTVDSLQVDIKKSSDILGWVPKFSFSTGIKETVEHYSEKNRK